MSKNKMIEKDGAAHEHVTNTDSKIYKNREEIIAYAAEFYSPGKLEVYRTPGTFVHEYLVGKMSLNQLVASIRSKMEHGLQCICCMDERVDVETVDGGLVISSHESCGAAGIVAHMVSTDAGHAKKYAAVVDAIYPGKTEELLAAYNTAKDSEDHDGVGAAQDAFGFFWSAALTEHVSKDFGRTVEHKHLKVDAHAHYTNAAIVSAAEGLQVNITGPVGVRTFSIDSSDRIVDEHTKVEAYDSMVTYAMLSVNIARGGHSSLAKDAPFMIAVIRDENFDEEQWLESWTKLGGLVEGNVYTLPTDELVSVEFISTKEIAEAKNQTR